jgi:hypothetical protein
MSPSRSSLRSIARGPEEARIVHAARSSRSTESTAFAAGSSAKTLRSAELLEHQVGAECPEREAEPALGDARLAQLVGERRDAELGSSGMVGLAGRGRPALALLLHGFSSLRRRRSRWFASNASHPAAERQPAPGFAWLGAASRVGPCG